MAELVKKIKAFGKRKLVVILALIALVFVGNRLREFSYASVPAPGEVADEYSFGWLGVSLLKDGYPTAWSGLDAYESHDYQKINVDGLFDLDPHRPAFSLDRPWFDHPPLFGLVTGGYAFIKGVRNFEDASVIILRRPMLKIAILTTLLIFILGFRLFGERVGLLAALLYSVVPTAVISSRLALAENGYLPIFLAALILADVYLEKRKNSYWLAAVGLASLALLFKLSAVAIAITLFFLALFFGKNKKAFLVKQVVVGVGVSLVLFGLYGAYYHWPTFVRVITENSQRFYGAGAENFFQAVSQFRLTTTKFLTDGWVLFGWIALFVLSFRDWQKDKGQTILTTASFSYLFVLLIFGSESYGWYKFPFFPFLLLAGAKLLNDLYEKPNLFVFLGVILLPFGSTLHRLVGIQGFQSYVLPLRLFSLLALALFAFSLVGRKRNLSIQRFLVVTATTFVVWLSMKLIFFYDVDQWFKVT